MQGQGQLGGGGRWKGQQGGRKRESGGGVKRNREGRKGGVREEEGGVEQWREAEGRGDLNATSHQENVKANPSEAPPRLAESLKGKK